MRIVCRSGSRARTSFSLVALSIASLATVARAQVASEFGPRGEVVRLGAGRTTYLENLGVALIKPGWDGKLAEQGGGSADGVRVETKGDTTHYAATWDVAGMPVRFRQAVKKANDGVAIDYEITPTRALKTEAVLLEGSLPVPAHAGKTQFYVAGDSPARGTLPAASPTDNHVLAGTDEAEWIGFGDPGGSALRIETRGVRIQLQDNRKWNTPAFGLLLIAGGGTLEAGKPIRFGIIVRETSAERLLADSKAGAEGELARLGQADDRPLAIRSLKLDRDVVSTFTAVDLVADVAATYDNPFDPEQIAVDAEVSAPDGSKLVVPGFFFAPMRSESRSSRERIVRDGPPGFRVRYAPAMVGTHRIALVVKGRGGTVRSAPVELKAEKGASHGFIRVAKSNPHYFAFDDGTPYFAVGENVCWSWGRAPLAMYAAWFKALGGAGGNWARLWLSNNEKGLEWTPAPTPKAGSGSYEGLGRYELGNAWQLDEVTRLARENGVRLMFCLGTYGEFRDGGYFNEGMWVSNPYNAKNGGPCARPEDFWTNPEAKRLYKRRLRYLIARWAAEPTLFAWEFWNEIPESPAEVAWTAEMAAYLKQHDPYKHLVSNTYGTAPTWKLPDVDFSMAHMYGKAGDIADFTRMIERETRAHLGFDKPYILAEFGIDWQTGDEKWDATRTGLNMHNGAWAGVMSGGAGTAMLWYWDSYVHPANLYHVLTPLRKFTDSVSWPTTAFRPIDGLKVEYTRQPPERHDDLTIPATVEWGKSSSNSYTVLRDGTVRGEPVAMTIGGPSRGNPHELFTTLTWHLDMPEAGKVLVRLGDVCTRARLRASVDGAVVLDRALEAGPEGKGPWKKARFDKQWNIWVSDYAEDIAIEVPAGRHELTLANVDGDWIQLRSLTLPRYRTIQAPPLHALGLGSDSQVLLWLHNTASTWRSEHDGKIIEPAEHLRVNVPAADGVWHLEWWDTFLGEVTRRETVRASGGVLPIELPRLQKDVAVKASR
ncbi:DUF5060 domain-containing protein [Aquisphaera insulae]|uniref:DUF5060 domain-containing protein n=1 Tax=Aquisphaera insulae TaxID=2712864 RepID=UPI0013EB830F|nr:DUF5060 domain-containing protein [Aquisphaera insulae]